MKIAIIGQGHVGKAFRSFIEGYFEYITYDPLHDKTYPEKDINEADIAVICVPTPQATDGSCDISIVEEAIARIATPYILIKSTIAPGTTDKLRASTGKKICFSPEYIGESTYQNPIHKTIRNTPFMIIGGPENERNYLFSCFELILGPHATYYGCNALDAEIIKYMENSFLAAKVTFVNEFCEIAKAYEANWYAIREGWLLDERIGRAFSSVFKDNRGFDGKCLPKDVSGIINASEAKGYSPQLLRQVLHSNDTFRGKKQSEATS
jgi:nucleotide sugar dehydrogenase